MKDNLKETEKEIKTLSKSLFTFFVLFTIMIATFVITHFLNKSNTWADSLFTATMIYLPMVTIWILIRFGFAEGIIAKVKNHQPANKDKKMTRVNIDRNRIYNSKKKQVWDQTWIGPIVAATVGIILLIVSLLGSYL